jgi:threonine synthase
MVATAPALGSILVRMRSALQYLECPECNHHYDARRLQTTCQDCNSPLLARYDLETARRTLNLVEAGARGRGIWRWSEILPVREQKHRITLGEGDTPLVAASRLGASIGLKRISIKDESGNPTGSFKARGLVMAVAKSVEFGVRDLVVPTAGNAGGALAAYAARAGIKAHIYMPADAPPANQLEVRAFGAETVLVDGLISDAGKLAAEDAEKHRWFDVSTFKEPYRVEGKKTMGLELVEQYGGSLPDVIVYPTGGGTGLVGMWKGFEEMEALGWIGTSRPRMVAVQAAGCAPVVRAIEAGTERIDIWEHAETAAAGLRVPGPFADRLILRAIRESNGTAVAVSEMQIAEAQAEMASTEGLLASPEGAATWAGLKSLAARGWIDADERVVLFNTGSGLKYI